MLAGLAGQLATGKRDEDAMLRLYELAVELRDKLRYSQGRIRGLKQELGVTSAAARAERHEALARLQELETEVARLAGAVQTQGSTLAARESVANAQASENDQLRRQVAALERQLQAQSAALAAKDATAAAEAADNEQLRRQLAAMERQLQAQGNALTAQESAVQAEAAESDQLRRQVAALERQLAVGPAWPGPGRHPWIATVNERNEALRHLDRMTRLLEESEGRVAAAQAEHNNILNELVATKGRVADLSALETLYVAARDELERLDKENGELKDMVAGGAVQLGRSRILEALGVPDSSDIFVSTRSGGGGGATGSGSGGKRASGASGALATRSRSTPRVRPSGGASATSPGTYGRGAFVPELVPASADTYRGRRGRSRSRSPGRRGGGLLEDPISEMAFLGPPSSAYPPDPENYIFYRVGGGYSPRLDAAHPTIPQPRASGWVPKDVVRLMQAFRHSYGLQLEWRFWEPLVLMIDEVYRSRADGTLFAMRTAQREKLKTIKRQLRSALGYPSAMANGKISHLQRQLSTARKVLASGDRKSEVPLKQMAIKDYHLGHQLDRAVEENYALRKSLEELEDLYSAAIDGRHVSSGVAARASQAAAVAAAAAAAATRMSPGVSAGGAQMYGSGGGGEATATGSLFTRRFDVMSTPIPRFSPRDPLGGPGPGGEHSFDFGVSGDSRGAGRVADPRVGGSPAVAAPPVSSRAGSGRAGSARTGGSAAGTPRARQVGVGSSGSPPPETADVGIDNASLSIAS
ncbi:hypothetical protein GPECTOR_58g563 [Gonium pectorale]|uniref:Uncharacterized protein n=1 Tax=Gonium pectorale TaxID=33097 RepID=A0A150G5L7_GONPE|nr:hypothetical protein GPECTOR_58g563 [Gonium pectorale]|eukprot:KXZ45114.1 hypothetical protein GPECTOR_58g563 [Gonium pectorale]